MEIILLQDIDKVGDKYEIVKVKPGYGRNFLIPKGMAIIANDANRKRLDEYKAKEAAKLAERLAEFQELAGLLKDKVLTIGAKAGTSGKIFGSVTNVQIAAALKEQFDVEVERRKVILPEEIKVLGTYTAQLDLHPEVEINVNFEVVAE
ncbi:MAG: 50S ribosomal protein L9 [Saprospiraceae bacterium]|nr:50S ribosomal protein L9 [Saprospiraceae bacterium]MCB0676110.1 50S ribosomal protein L9 [Saprospiraceae bacterium]